MKRLRGWIFNFLVVMAIIAMSIGCSAATTSVLTIQGAQSGSPYDQGVARITVYASNGNYVANFAYGQFSTRESIAAGLAATIAKDCNAPVKAKSLGNQVRLVARGMNISFTAVGQLFPDQLPTSVFAFDATSYLTDTTTQLATSANPVSPGGSLTFTATVTSGATGSVTFFDGTNQLGTSALSGIHATIVTSSLTAGEHLIKARYQGDSSFAGSDSNEVVQRIQVPSNVASGTVLYNYSITDGNSGSGYESNGNVLSYVDSVNGSWKMSYDALNRLTSRSSGSGSMIRKDDFGYDSFGNRNWLRVSRPVNVSSIFITSYDARNHVAPVSYGAPNGLPYDDDGNVRVFGNQAFLYDGAGRICAEKSQPVNGLTSMYGYLYDAEGQRIARGTIAVFSCDLTTNQFTPVSQYLRGANGEEVTELDEHDEWVHTNVYADGKLLGTYADDGLGIHFALSDWLGTKRMQIAPDNTIESTWISGPWGEDQSCVVCSVADATAKHFTGKERDAESGLDYFGARYYGSTMGRFSSPDPGWFLSADLENPQTLNQYAYVLNNPLGLVDPDGLDGEKPCNQAPVNQNGGVTPIDPNCLATGKPAPAPNPAPAPTPTPAPNPAPTPAPAPTDPKTGDPLPPPTQDVFGNPILPPGTIWVPGGGSQGGSRDVRWKPSPSVPGQSQPNGSWDPNYGGHWDINNGLGGRGRFTPNGTPVDHYGRPQVRPGPARPVFNRQIIGGISVGLGGYITYRVIRMLPSLLPPLWETIPANLALP
ncbi:RHS repeat-associated core domain-containing protein [Terriglobus tenax]|uniref:RHS repeat-associated core domain-containing protein n=1 Tax=Terriglobus tenax TaxID=1111115 RepID=UPI0021E0F4A3|nr:RHS repeat-associated core domain-containing protein [Terriglobus tenax]